MSLPKSPKTIEEFLEFIKQLREAMETDTQLPQQVNKQPKDNQGPSVSLDSIIDQSGSSGSSVGSGAGGSGPAGVGGTGTSASGAAGSEGAGGLGGAGGMAAIIAAAIAGQHLLSRQTDREFEGQKTDDIFSGSIGTEPWFAFLGDKLDLDVSAGEKFDASLKNKDYGTALKRLPATADYWADPIRSWLAGGGEALGTKIGGKKAGKVTKNIMNPIGALLGLIGK